MGGGILARPTKQTVDYFPHFVTESKTKFMLENRYGNDGYAFWFKLLELLCRSDGHFYDCSSVSDWEYLLALTKVPEETALEILEKLSDMGKIDSSLWSKHKVIWCESLVNNLAPVYSKRTVSAPKKPEYDEFPNRKPHENEVTGTDNPQSKVEESIGDKSITPPISPSGGNENAKDNSGESLLVETATGDPSQVSPSKTRKSRKKAELTASQRASFDRFWELWPNKVSKGQAEITWAKMDPDEELFKAILAGVERAKKYDKRFLDGYMPHASTWLNAKGWLDEFNNEGGVAIGTNKQITVQSGFRPSTGFRKKV
jgi:hypothetical protein